MSNDWIPIAEANLDRSKRYEITSITGHVYVCHPNELGRALMVAVREYNPTPYVPPTPIDPGEGWRLLKKDEPKRVGDQYINAERGGVTWSDIADDGIRSKNLIYRRRIEPQYRPFANAEEYKPHRERWLVSKTHGDVVRLMSYQENSNWKFYFERYVFEDTGTPFGVEVEATK